MLKKIYRGLSADEVSELFGDESRYVADSFFHINWMPADQSHPQFAVITPKKLGLNAVERNRYQRRIYSTISKHFSSWTAGIRVAIVVKKSATTAKSADFARHLKNLLSSLQF